ncbi:uncharacterized protein LOC101206496 isoform X2 [Cucumis sativus]|uniref:SnoaL-like domain-containing protein n=1 Tax=Cucumis sativus TaxID=3659 RepID=A0A0A0KUR1_CUCSA|nr:uncharacterized protein LOC101206496 isoform X2 [Cucumis sativus]KGN52177.1 hypothetical protein Csa_008580 [Cucumis sativus]
MHVARHRSGPQSEFMGIWRPRLQVLLRGKENWRILEEQYSLRLRSLLFLKMPGGGEITADPTIEACTKEACDSKTTKRLADDIMPHILNLYGSSATPRDFEIYAPDASFEDPLTRAHGVKEIKSAFYSLSKVFSESRIVEYNFNERLISPGKHEITVDNKQHYKFLGRNIDLESLIKLYVVEGKIVRHEDWWNKKPLLNRETVQLPMVGRFLEMTRRCAMLATHAMMGFGKD